MDALDSKETRSALFCAAKLENIPIVHAAVNGWWAQAAFIPPGGALSNALGETPGEDIKVISFAPGMAAAMQASIAARYLLGYPCENDLHVWNMQTMEYKRLTVPG
jgi:hypothetical protein